MQNNNDAMPLTDREEQMYPVQVDGQTVELTLEQLIAAAEQGLSRVNRSAQTDGQPADGSVYQAFMQEYPDIRPDEIPPLPTHDPVHQITIIPRGQALGLTWSMPKEESTHTTRNEMYEDIIGLLGGRVAEDIVFHDVSTGASNDIDRASQLARDMVARFGMCKELGTVSYTSDDEVFIGGSYGKTRSYSERVAGVIDEQVKKLMDEAYAKCTEILTADRDKLERIADFLVKYETMSAEQFNACMEGRQIDEEAHDSLFDSFQEPSKEAVTAAEAETEEPTEE